VASYKQFSGRFLVAASLGAVVACGGGNSNPMTPGLGTGSPGPSGATITISAGGVVSPSAVTINSGESVTFVNNHSQSHQIASNPHPAHTDCPAINALDTINGGQTKLTNALTTSRTCGFHDHNDPSNGSLQGTITIR
jgi:plastocyanin